VARWRDAKPLGWTVAALPGPQGKPWRDRFSTRFHLSLMPESARALAWTVRRRSWKVKSILIRQVARKAFDLTHFGQGAFERIASALVLGAMFFFVALIVCSAIGLEIRYGLGIAAAELITVMATSAALVLWSTDEGLDKELAQVRLELPALREQLAEQRELEAVARSAADLDRAFERARQAEKDRQADIAREQQQIIAERRRREMLAQPVPCPYCREPIDRKAIKCHHCGEILDPHLKRARSFSPGVAAVLSFFWPGLGQMYKGYVLAGVVWMIMTIIGYFFCILPGVVLHLINIFDAASGGE
jgi:TM2 domain-containing membrane protein YozV